MSSALPSVEQAREALALINVGRKAIGLSPVAKFDLDDPTLTPNQGDSCLSAKHLFAYLDLYVGPNYLEAYGDRTSFTERQHELFEAIGAKIAEAGDGGLTATIPDAIRAVTDPFDREVKGLRERLREAGVA